SFRRRGLAVLYAWRAWLIRLIICKAVPVVISDPPGWRDYEGDVMSVRGRSARYGTLTLLLAALLALAACSSGGSGSGSSTSPASATSPIAIGYEVPLTGTAAVAGKQEQQGWNLGLKVFGSTVNGHHIVTYFEDTGGDPTVALSDARSLVQQKHIQLMMGPLLASEDAAVAPYLGTLRIPTDNLALCGATQLTFDAQYRNPRRPGRVCAQPG